MLDSRSIMMDDNQFAKQLMQDEVRFGIHTYRRRQSTAAGKQGFSIASGLSLF